MDESQYSSPPCLSPWKEAHREFPGSRITQILQGSLQSGQELGAVCVGTADMKTGWLELPGVDKGTLCVEKQGGTHHLSSSLWLWGVIQKRLEG